MENKLRPSIWFYIGLASLALALGPFGLGFLAILTWGTMFIPVAALIWFAPLMLLHWVLWGRNLSQQAPQAAQGGECAVADVPAKSPTPMSRILWLTGIILVVIGVVLYYLCLFGGFLIY